MYTPIEHHKIKSRYGSAINDPRTEKFDLLLIQEPPTTAYRTHVTHRIWRLFQPSNSDIDGRTRSLPSVNRRMATCTYEQLRCPHPDIVALGLRNEGNYALVCSVYVPLMDSHLLNEPQTMHSTLDAINSVIRSHTENPERWVKLVVAGDFNRNHPAWTNGDMYERMMLHAEELVNFMQFHGLKPCLPNGTPTYWSIRRPGQRSTLDTTLSNTLDTPVK